MHWSYWFDIDAYGPEPLIIFEVCYLYMKCMYNFMPCPWLLCIVSVPSCFDDCKVPSCCYGQIVVISCLECMCCTVAPFWACSIWNLLRIACSFIMLCWILILSVFAWCLNAFCINAMFNLFCSYLLGRSSELNELYM